MRIGLCIIAKDMRAIYVSAQTRVNDFVPLCVYQTKMYPICITDEKIYILMIKKLFGELFYELYYLVSNIFTSIAGQRLYIRNTTTCLDTCLVL